MQVGQQNMTPNTCTCKIKRFYDFLSTKQQNQKRWSNGTKHEAWWPKNGTVNALNINIVQNKQLNILISVLAELIKGMSN